MGILDSLNLPTLGEQGRCAKPKHQIEASVVTREVKRQAKKLNAKTFRDEVWRLDGGRCRATGVALSRGGTDPHTVGEVDHSIPRSLAPELIYEVSNGLLIAKFLNRLRKVACAEAPEFRMFDYTPVQAGDTNRRHPQRFIWRDRTGKVIKEHIG